MNILITRPSPDGEELVNKIRDLGKHAYHLPIIYFSHGKTLFLLKKKLDCLSKGDFLFIISQHAVQYAHFQLLQLGTYWPSTIKYYSIGKKTSSKMHTLSGIKSKYPDTEETSEKLLQLPELKYNTSGRRALILKGNNGRTLLQNTLQKRGISVLCCECYTRKMVKYNWEIECKRMLTLNINTIVITTSEILKQLHSVIPENYRVTWLMQCQLIVISTRLETIARNLGWTNVITTKSADNNSILNILYNY